MIRGKTEIINNKLLDRTIKSIADSYEIDIKNKSKEIRHWMISGAPNFNLNGEVIGSIGIHLDITEKKKLKEMLPANKKEKKGKITDLTKHDVDSFKHFYSKDKVEKEDKDDKDDKEDECMIIETKTKLKKEERKEERKEENINIFKYDRKIVEREYQERYQHLHNQNQVARNNRNNTTSTRYSTPSIQKATTLSSLAL
jgi:hypothetical protein